jgi:hypothetical protein
MALLRVLMEYPGVGIPHDLVEARDVSSNPQALVDAGICEWVDGTNVNRRNDEIETTIVTPVRETTAATPVRRAPVRQRRENT